MFVYIVMFILYRSYEYISYMVSEFLETFKGGAHFFGKESSGKLLHFDPKSNPEIGDDMRPDLTNLTPESCKKRRKLGRKAARMTHVHPGHCLITLFELKFASPQMNAICIAS